MKKYKGNYATFEEPVESNSLIQLQEHIENSAGYTGNPKGPIFREYETAWVYEYDDDGKRIAGYYFSMLNKQWNRVVIK